MKKSGEGKTNKTEEKERHGTLSVKTGLECRFDRVVSKE